MHKRLIALAAALILVAGTAYAQTDTPTSTPTSTPTNTPTQTPTFTPTHTPTHTPTPVFQNTSRIFVDAAGAILRTGSGGEMSAWTEMPRDPVFEFVEIEDGVTWKLWCRMENSWPNSTGEQMVFDDGSTTVTATSIKTLRGSSNPALTPPATDRSFVRWCRIELDACDTCDGIVRYGSRE